MTPTRVPLVDLQGLHAPLRAQMLDAVARVIDRGQYLLGPETEAFEREFATHEGAAGAVACGSGSDALLLALLAFGIGPGDIVITVANSFLATAESVVRAGATPWFAEPDPTSHCIDPASVSRLLRSPGAERVRAVIPVHLYGERADLEALRRVLGESYRPDIRLISDAAQAHGVPDIVSRSDVSCFSFYPGKNLGALGDGGAVLGDDLHVLDLIRRLRNHGRSGKHGSDRVGLNSRFDEIQAAMLRAKLPHLRAWNDRRRALAARYDRALSPLAERGWLRLPVRSADHVVHLYVVQVHASVRDAVADQLERRSIGVGQHYPVPTHHMPPYAAAALPTTEVACARVLSLPLSPAHDDDVIDFVCEAVTAVLTELEPPPWDR